MFLKIQEAYQHLIDPIKRQAYDSHYEFDEAVPKSVFKSNEHFLKSVWSSFRTKREV